MITVKTSQVNNGKETVNYQYRKIQIGIPVFMDDILAARSHKEVIQTISNCEEMEEEQKFTYGLKKTKYMVINTGSNEGKEIFEQVEARQIGKTSKHN